MMSVRARVPSNPDRNYKDGGWQGWGHWLGTGTVATHLRVCLPFQEALAFVRSLGLKSEREWVVWIKSGTQPANIPSTPYSVYHDDGWQGWGHWLGTGAVASRAWSS